MIPLLVLAAHALTPQDIDFASSLDLVDQLGWAASDATVERFRREATAADGVFAASLKTSAYPALRRLHDPTIYAVHAELGGDSDLTWLHIREGVLFTNRTRRSLDTLAFRVLPAGQDVRAGRFVVRGVWTSGVATQYVLEDTILGVRLPQALRPGETVRLVLEVVQEVPPFRVRGAGDVDRLTPETTGAYGRSGDRINLGYWLPLLTPVTSDGEWDVRRLPRNGEHSWFDPALFLVVMDLPPAVEVASSGVEVFRERGPSGTTVVAVAAGAREFAVNIGNFDISSRAVGDTTIRVFHSRDEPAVGAHLLRYGEGALSFFENTLGPIPDREVDIVETSVSVALGNEFPGLVTIDAHGTDGGRYRASSQHEWTVAHELAHQWWYAAVGNDAQALPWLDEALTSATAALYWERRYGRDAVEGLYQVDVVDPYEEMWRRGVPDLPASLPGARYDLLQYGAIVYGKAVLYLDHVRQDMGDAAFVEALREHYEQHLYADVRAGDLLEILFRRMDDPERGQALYERWIGGAHGFEDILGRTAH